MCCTLGYKMINQSERYLVSNRRLNHPEIVKLYQDGNSLDKVASMTGASKAGVHHVLRLWGIPLRQGAKRTDTEQRLGFPPTKEWLSQVMEEHDTARSAAECFHIPYPTFIGLLEQFGIPRKRWHGGPGGHTMRQDIPVEEAAKLSADGVTYYALSRKYNVSMGVVARRLHEIGHEAPRDKQNRLPHYEVFAGAPYQKQKILRELGITACEICDFDQALDFCHIVPQKDGGPTVSENCLVLCPNHHRLYDKNLLSTDEKNKVKSKVRRAFKLFSRAKATA